jgi:hypothetical protein
MRLHATLSPVRAPPLFAALAVLAAGAAIWLYLDNRDLRQQLASRPAPTSAQPAETGAVASPEADLWIAAPGSKTPRMNAGAAPSLPEAPKESRLERRQRRQAELAAMLGRLDGETDEEYRNRIIPLIAAGLLVPRQRVDEMRRHVEEKAGVTPSQSKRLDEAFDKVYADALDYTNKAIADGLLSPYERNVSGWLEYAGGLGGLLNEANGQIGQILSPSQVKAISESGFEWGEYLGAKAPWEQLNPPPPPR